MKINATVDERLSNLKSQISDLRHGRDQSNAEQNPSLRRQISQLKLRKCFIVVIVACRLIKKHPQSFTQNELGP